MMVGTPGETEKTVSETVAFMNALPITDSPSTAVLRVLPGTLLYRETRECKQIDDSDWLKQDTVPYYTIDHSFNTLGTWANMIRGSGNRIAFDHARHFWKGILQATCHEVPWVPAAWRDKLAKVFTQSPAATCAMLIRKARSVTRKTVESVFDRKNRRGRILFPSRPKPMRSDQVLAAAQVDAPEMGEGGNIC
jgi:hypothetical protein